MEPLYYLMRQLFVAYHYPELEPPLRAALQTLSNESLKAYADIAENIWGLDLEIVRLYRSDRWSKYLELNMSFEWGREQVYLDAYLDKLGYARALAWELRDVSTE